MSIKPAIQQAKRSVQKISRERLLRSVASSCAIEGKQSVADIERQLKQRNPQFSHVSLAFK